MNLRTGKAVLCAVAGMLFAAHAGSQTARPANTEMEAVKESKASAEFSAAVQRAGAKGAHASDVRAARKRLDMRLKMIANDFERQLNSGKLRQAANAIEQTGEDGRREGNRAEDLAEHLSRSIDPGEFETVLDAIDTAGSSAGGNEAKAELENSIRQLEVRVESVVRGELVPAMRAAEKAPPARKVAPTSPPPSDP